MDTPNCGKQRSSGPYWSGIVWAPVLSVPTGSLHSRVGYLPSPRQNSHTSTTRGLPHRRRPVSTSDWPADYFSRSRPRAMLLVADFRSRHPTRCPRFTLDHRWCHLVWRRTHRNRDLRHWRHCIFSDHAGLPIRPPWEKYNAHLLIFTRKNAYFDGFNWYWCIGEHFQSDLDIIYCL